MTYARPGWKIRGPGCWKNLKCAHGWKRNGADCGSKGFVRVFCSFELSVLLTRSHISWSWEDLPRVSSCRHSKPCYPCSPQSRSLIIEELQSGQSKPVVIFAYCRYMDDPTALHVLRSLLHQLLTSYADLTLPILKAECKKFSTQKASLLLSDAVKILQSVLQQSGTTWVIIDGLDEIVGNEKTTLLKALDQLPAQLLVTSRPLELFVQYLSSPVFLRVKAQDKDIETFIVETIKADPSLLLTLERHPGAIDDIVQRIQANAQGMYVPL